MDNQETVEDTIVLDELESSDQTEETPQTETIDSPKRSEAEIKAIEQGWNPDREAYEKANPGKKWRPAEDFNERGQLLSTIHDLKRTTSSYKERFDTLENHYKNVREHTRAQVEKELRQQLRQAADIGDHEAVNRITDEIVNHKSVQDDIKQPNAIVNDIQEEVTKFSQRNAHWFTNDPLDYSRYDASRDAIAYEDQLARTRPDLPIAKRFEAVENFIRSKYPERFTNIKRNAPSAVESASPIGKPSKREVKISDLPSHHQRLIRTLKPESQKQYIADLKAIGEI